MLLVCWLQGGDCMPRATDGATANNEVRKAQAQARRKKRGSYHHNDEETRTKIAKYSCENGNRAAAAKFSAELGHVVTESTVGNMKKSYLVLLQKEKDPKNIKTLPHAARGRPLLLREYDKDVAESLNCHSCS